MAIGLTKIKHVKLPVSDLQRSVSWYRSLLDLELRMEFVEGGIIRGASLLARDGGYEIAVRNKDVCAGTIDAQGFDLFALSVPSRALLDDVAARCDRLGVSHSGVQDFPGLRRWDGYPRPGRHGCTHRLDEPALPPFVGVASDKNGTAQPYFPPRLRSER